MQLAPEDVQELRFTVVKGSNPGAKLSFEPGTRIIRIGRGADNDIVIADPSVSRSHARVEIRADGYSIADAGSTAGLEKMGFRVGKEAEPLASGDEFKLGDTILKFEVIAKRGGLKRAAGRESAKPKGPSPIENLVGAFRRALGTMGLRRPLTQAVAAVCFLALIAIGLWPEPPTIPEQYYWPLSIDYNAVWGYGVGDDSHADGAVFTLPTDAEGAALFFRLLPGAGVEIRTGERIVTKVEPGGETLSFHVLVLPRALARTGEPHLVFDHLGYEAEQGAVPPDAVPPWAVGRMWMLRVPEATASPARLTADLTAMKELHGRLEDDPAHRYNLAKGLRTSMVALMKLAGRTAVGFPIPFTAPVDFEGQVESAIVEIREGRLERGVDRLLPALQTAEIELNREYTKLANTLTVLQKKESTADIAVLVPQILRMIPEPTDVRHRSALEATHGLVGKDLDTFQGEMQLQ